MSYRKAALYFFTGTGNSYRVAAWMAEAARQAGADTTIRPIESARPAQEIGSGTSALLGLVMPLRATEGEESVGMDIVQHGEEAYASGEGAILVAP